MQFERNAQKKAQCFGAICIEWIFLISFTPQVARAVLPWKPLLTPTIEALKREEFGYQNQVFDSYYDLLGSKFIAPEEDWLLDPSLFVGAQKAIVSRVPIIQIDRNGPMLRSRWGFSLPIEMFNQFYLQLKRAYMESLDWDTSMAEAAAGQIEKQAVELAQINYSDYIRLVGRRGISGARSRMLIARALIKSDSISIIEHRFDVPFGAGYAEKNPRFIFIDRSIKLIDYAADQTFLPISSFLNLHELTEKALLDKYGLTYQHAHQIALRAEKLGAEAININWTVYDDYMKKVLESVGKVEGREFYISPLLDMLPYYSYIDDENLLLIKKMESAKAHQK
ncbi:MAG: hypothetical protein ACXWRA_12240 [Pseudobdellovibrionaceae bacterium]